MLAESASDPTQVLNAIDGVFKRKSLTLNGEVIIFIENG